MLRWKLAKSKRLGHKCVLTKLTTFCIWWWNVEVCGISPGPRPLPVASPWCTDDVIGVRMVEGTYPIWPEEFLTAHHLRVQSMTWKQRDSWNTITWVIWIQEVAASLWCLPCVVMLHYLTFRKSYLKTFQPSKVPLKTKYAFHDWLELPHIISVSATTITLCTA